jgi:hypothetical protein
MKRRSLNWTYPLLSTFALVLAISIVHIFFNLICNFRRNETSHFCACQFTVIGSGLVSRLPRSVRERKSEVARFSSKDQGAGDD